MEILLDPNIIYILFVLGTMLGLLALTTPGTGALELGAIFVLFMAGYGASIIPINIWALIVIALSVFPFILAFLLPKWRTIWLASTILFILFGSIFLFLDSHGWPAINPVIAIFTSLISGGLLWFGFEKGFAAMQVQPTQDLERLIGMTGEAKTAVHAQGSVQVAGELWSARSKEPLSKGSQIKVVERQGFVLIVEKI